jgi:phosphoglycolate phosphatase-like HAD superfamily hydrolase
MNRKLLLFDIDGTLLDTGGAGGSSLLDAAEEVLQVSRTELPPLDLAGATDSGVVRKLFNDAKQTWTAERADAFHTSYLSKLHMRLHHESFDGRLLEGVESLLAALQNNEQFVLGLLTGNLRRGADLKLKRFGIDHHFMDGGFGDDAENRNDIGPFALQRMNLASEQVFTPDQVIVIGDTPKDIACANALGARCLAVATGKFDTDSLSEFKAWALLENLSQTDQVMALLKN